MIALKLVLATQIETLPKGAFDKEGGDAIESLETFEKSYRGVREDRIEYGMAFDKEWNDLYSKPIIGKEGSISMPLPKGYKNWRNINVAHTHPNEYGGTFSPADIVAFRKHRPLSTSAVANEGTYSIAPISNTKNRWVDFQSAYDTKYATAINHYLDELNEICMKRGAPPTLKERKKVDEQIAKVMNIWLGENAQNFGFRYSFKKA